MAYYGYAVSNNPKMWGEQGKKAVSEKNWKEYIKRNGRFFMYSGILMALLASVDALITLPNLVYILILVGGEVILYYPFGKWMKENENTWNAWPKIDKKDDAERSAENAGKNKKQSKKEKRK